MFYLDLDASFKHLNFTICWYRNWFWWNCLFANAIGMLSWTRSPAAKVSWDASCAMLIRRLLLLHRGKATRSKLGKLGPPLADQSFPSYKIIQFENFEGGISHSTESINEGSTKKCYPPTSPTAKTITLTKKIFQYCDFRAVLHSCNDFFL